MGDESSSVDSLSCVFCSCSSLVVSDLCSSSVVSRLSSIIGSSMIVGGWWSVFFCVIVCRLSFMICGRSSVSGGGSYCYRSEIWRVVGRVSFVVFSGCMVSRLSVDDL